ncbi:MAG TPA: NAD(P)H-hydrate dehydratase [Clostridiaceae bacterium]|mgnify:CR=1 FL=1|nr:NAD(P)H-hydrate dehydratase [Clostridiaceae bacterium]
MEILENSLPTINSASQKYLDQAFVKEFDLPGIILMEQAAAAVTELIIRLEKTGNKVLFLAGAGNNGGDAWASARQLAAYGFEVSVLDLFPDKSLPADAAQNKTAYLKSLDYVNGQVFHFDPDSFQEHVISFDYIVDGIMGTGFNLRRPLSRDILDLLKIVNSCKSTCRIAIDIPTGIDSVTGACDQEVFLADYTVTFSALKTGMAAEPGCVYCGEIFVAPLSMQKSWLESKLSEFIKESDSGFSLPRVLTLDTISSFETERSKLSHKGKHGKTLLIGGSEGMSGAMILALQAAHATGIGYAYVRTPQTVVADLLKVSPESLIAEIPGISPTNNADTMNNVNPSDNSRPADNTDPILKWKNLIAEVDSVGLGPGAGKAEWLTDYFIDICSTAKKLIIDADGLNYLAKIEDWEQLCRDRLDGGMQPAILTPHPGEFKRLAPDLTDLLNQDRQVAAVELAKRSSTFVVLKGHATVLALPSGEVYINSSGNQSLAKAGSGDVLTGLLSGFTAQMPNQTDAVALAVFFHGMLADLAVADLGVRGVLPGKLADYAPAAYRKLGWNN